MNLCEVLMVHISCIAFIKVALLEIISTCYFLVIFFDNIDVDFMVLIKKHVNADILAV